MPHEEAARIQERLAALVCLTPLAVLGPEAPAVAAGADVAYSNDGRRAWAAAVALDRRMHLVGSCLIEDEPDGAYARGFLAFREGRLLIRALQALAPRPDVVFLDGHGVVHERGLGLASHVGVLLGLPTIGVAKTPFAPVDRSPGLDRGDFVVFTTPRGAQGAAVRLKARSKQVYVSPGHLTDLASAIELALVWSTGRRRVPEPLARAHTLSVLARAAAQGDPEARRALASFEETQ
ncbi:MAG: endonuclease V [Coriobacteriia bacterium]|nr:endonuclease V [Coriobacteriia bacterium]